MVGCEASGRAQTAECHADYLMPTLGCRGSFTSLSWKATSLGVASLAMYLCIYPVGSYTEMWA